MQWQLIDEGALQFRPWDDEFVVYNALTGDTHILETPAAEILLVLRRGPMEISSLAQLLADKWQCEPGATFLDELEMTLSDMVALSLLERA